jgi:Flp pilus assembly protein TadD
MKNIILILVVFAALNASAQNNKADDETYNKLYNDGTTLIGEKKFKEALDLFNRAITLKKSSAEAIFARGTCYLMLNERENACIDFNSAKALKLTAADEYILKYCEKDAPGRTQKPLNNK